MSTSKPKATQKPKLIDPISNDELLGYLPEYMHDVSIGDGSSKNKQYIYKKLHNHLKIESNNYKRELDVYFSSAETDDLNLLLNYLLPKSRV